MELVLRDNVASMSVKISGTDKERKVCNVAFHNLYVHLCIILVTVNITHFAIFVPFIYSEEKATLPLK